MTRTDRSEGSFIWASRTFYCSRRVRVRGPRPSPPVATARSSLPRSNDLRRREGLRRVARCVLGGMVQQPEDGAGQLLPPHRARLEQSFAGGRAYLGERTLDGGPRRGHERRRGGGRIAGLALGPEVGHLRVAERVSTRVGEEPVEDARDVLQVEADRR